MRSLGLALALAIAAGVPSPAFAAELESDPPVPGVPAKYQPVRGAVLTPGGDALGYAKVPRPYTKAAVTRAVVKILAHKPDDTGIANCSGAVMDSEAGSFVLTAAHCVYNNKADSGPVGWRKNVTVTPAHDPSAKVPAPYGTWAAVGMWVPKEWEAGGDAAKAYDVAVLAVAHHRYKGRLKEVTGSALTPKITNDGAFGQVRTYGYPADSPPEYTGDEMFTCTADTRVGRPGTHTWAATDNCALRGGNSGGPVVDADGKQVGVAARRFSQGKDAPAGTEINRLDPRIFGPLLTRAEQAKVVAEAEVSVAVAGPTAMTPGDVASFAVTVTNNGPLTTNALVVTSSYTNGQLASMSVKGPRDVVNAADCKPTPGTLRCAVGELPAGAALTITVGVRAGSSGPIEGRTDATATTADSKPDNNRAVTTTRVR